MAKIKRYCIQCGGPVKGITGLNFYHIKDEVAKKMDLKNPVYQFVHIKCSEAFENDLSARAIPV